MRRVVIIAAFLLIALVGFGAYLNHLYGQLQLAFNRQDQFTPTRIFSDVTRISPPQPRALVEERLKSLGYSFHKSPQSEDLIEFNLHSIDYPTYLLPDNHPIQDIRDSANQPITLHFSGVKADASLESIELDHKEIPDLYLEPELVATLSKGNTLTAGGKREIRSLIAFQDIPAPIWQSIISIEDHTFEDHMGLNPKGIARAIWVNIRTHSFAQGGSTITQQLVKNLMARHTKNVFRKINEVFLALLLELKFDKKQILERYLNEVYLGQVGSLEVHGVVEGAEHFFGKKLSELNLRETAMMAGLIRGPIYYSPYRYRDRALERGQLVLRKMVENGYVAEEEAKVAMNEPIRLAPPQTIANKAPYFTDFVKAELIRQLQDKVNEQEIPERGFRVYTTLDMPTNHAAQTAVADGLTTLEKNLKLQPTDRLEGALASVDHSTGFIRALIGGRSYAHSTFNRILNMKRQVGSTFKPIVYLSAILKGVDAKGAPYGPGHPIEDAPWKLIYDRGNQEWSPRNYEKGGMGWISFRTALAHSVNTAAAKLGFEVGADQIISTARQLGIQSDLPKVPSLALGVAELSPIELLRVYATLANHGVQDELTVIRAITEPDGTAFAHNEYHAKQIFPPGPVDLLTDMLQNIFTEGTARSAQAMGFDRPAAGKTGTTSQYRDSWFAGYTPQLTTVVWVGMDQTPTPAEKEVGKKEKKKKFVLTGATSALPIWVAFMKNALIGDPPNSFPLSAHLTDVQIDRHTGMAATPECPMEQTIVEKYVKGQEPHATSCEPSFPATESETRGP